MKILTRINILSLFLLLFPLTASTADPNALSNTELPLPQEKAFRPSFSLGKNNTLIAEWKIEKGYYLYRDKFKFTSKTAGIKLGKPAIPKGKKKKDPLFGVVEVFRNQVRIEIPFTLSGPRPAQIELAATSQGCADMGLCYPPHTAQVKLKLPPAPATAKTAPAPAPEKTLEQASIFSNNLGLQDDQTFLDADKAFAFRVERLDHTQLKVSWTIAPGYYLYRDKFTFKFLQAPAGARLGKPVLPAGKKKKDPQFGVVEVYYQRVEINVPITGLAVGQAARIEVGYQGCADAGLCYPPTTKTVSVGAAAGLPKTTTTQAKPAAKPATTAPAGPGTKTTPAAAGTKTVSTKLQQSDSKLSLLDRLALAFKVGDLPVITVLTLIVGVLAAFTACLYPLFPIVASIITSQSGQLSAGRGFFLTLVYVESMSVTLGVVGAVMGGLGSSLGIQAALQQDWALIAFITLFIVLALSMFGIITLQLPTSLQSKFNAMSNRQSGSTVTGVAIMGALSALIAGPCSTPYLATTLAGIISSESILVGFVAMFAMGNGMGLPLLVIGAGGGELLKKPGPWMQTVKSSGGMLLLAVSLVFLGRIGSVPEQVTMLLWALWFISAGVFMRALEPLGEHKGGWAMFWKSIGVFSIVYGVLVALGGLTGGRNWTDPLHGSSLLSGGRTPVKLSTPAAAPRIDITKLNPKVQRQLRGKQTLNKGLLTFIRIKTAADFERELKAANAAGLTVMLDFYADWCTYCKQFDDYVFADPRVYVALRNTVLLQADITRYDARDKALLKRVKVILPPAILFFRTDGKEVVRQRVNGFMKADKFLQRIDRAFR